MKYKYLVLADEDTVLGFRAAGVPGRAVGTSADVVQALNEARERGVGIVIITEEVADSARAEIDALRFGGALPMVVEIPGAQGPLPNRRSLADVIREAIGVRV